MITDAAELARVRAEGGAKGGRPKVGDEKPSVDSTEGYPKGGQSKANLLRRLAAHDRDHGTDWLGVVERGERTVNGAAKAAGIIRTATPTEAAQKALAKLSPEERVNVIANLQPNGEQCEQGRQRPDQSETDHGGRDDPVDTARNALRALPVSEAIAALEVLRLEFGA